MKRRILIAGTLVCSVLGMLAADAARSDMVVHEWGTFLAMNGSDGVTLDGMYHEEHALPAFVHSRGRDQLRLRQSNMKGETPVIYFYTPRPARVYVHVAFPHGLWTQWYPQASMVGPGLVQAGAPPRMRNGRIDWNVDVVPAAVARASLPATSADALWNYAREVDAAYVTPSDAPRPGRAKEWERFIFYRGLGEAPLPFEAHVASERVTAATTEPDGLRHLFILRVEEGRGAYAYVPSLEAGTSLERALPSMDGAMPIDQFAGRVADVVAARLVESGLFEKEARAMVNTWRSSYFKTPGVRVLFVLPQSWTDRFIPLRVDPQAAQVVRVMVGRVELLDEERERRAEAAIRDVSSSNAGVREQAFAVLRSEGRYVEPIVRRTLRATTDERVRLLARRLLLTDFVTDLRTALTDADTGEKVLTDPVYVRAQLASLLREIGLTDEAKQEGEATLSRLERMPPPMMSDHASRNMYRALARAHEGAGNDAQALNWYGQFIRFGSQVATAARTCSGCHGADGPRDMTFFIDWYAGRKFAELAAKTGEAPQLIAAHEAALAARPSDVAAQLSLAYLYDARGEEAKTRAMWARIDPTTR